MKTKYKVLIGILGAFLLLNIAWVIYYFCFINTYAEVLGLDEAELYSCSQDGYLFYAATPDYLSFTSNLAITQIRTGGYVEDKPEEQDEVICDLLIWPALVGEDEYGLIIELRQPGQKTQCYNYLMNADAELDDPESYDEAVLQVLEENKEAADVLFQHAFRMWPELTNE